MGGRYIDGTELHRLLDEDASGILEDNPVMNWTEEDVKRFGIRLELKDGATAPKPEVRRVAHGLLPTVREQLRELLDAGIIERGRSSTGAPIHLVPKPRKKNPDGTWKEQTWRTVIDFRAINRALKYTSHPTPNMADTVNNLRDIAIRQHKDDQERGITPDRTDATADDPKTAYFSVLDLSKAFYTLPVHPESKWLTCFIVPQVGSFLWKGMPMGLACSPSMFVEATQRRLRPWQILYEPGDEQPLQKGYDKPLTATFTPHRKASTKLKSPPTTPQADGPSGQVNQATPVDDSEMLKARSPPTQFMEIYIDDCVIVTASYAQHIRAVKRFLEACRTEGMYVNKKAVLGCKTITYVGYCIGYDGVSADPDKVEAVREMPSVLTSKKQVRTFLGKIMFFSSFVPALGEYTRSLGRLEWV